MKPEFNLKHNKPLIASIAFLGIIIITFIVAAIVNIIRANIYTATLHLTIAPSSSEILVNGERFENGDHQVKPGDYVVEITKDGFSPESRHISIPDGGAGYVYVALTPDEENSDWYNTHPEDAALMDPIKSYAVEQNYKNLGEKYPITTRLPLNVDTFSDGYATHTKYSISYRVDDDNLTLIITDYTGGSREAALEKIRARGFNPDDYKIEYIDETDFDAKAR